MIIAVIIDNYLDDEQLLGSGWKQGRDSITITSTNATIAAAAAATAAATPPPPPPPPH